MSKLIIKEATKGDLKDILALVRELAEYENLLDSLKGDEKAYGEALFEREYAKALILEYENEMIGYAIYFYTFSSFWGRGGLWLEDLYIRSKYRKMGFGKEVFKFLGKMCKEQDLRRLEWVCLHENPLGIGFYEKLKAQNINDKWILYRLSGKELENLGKLWAKI